MHTVLYRDQCGQSVGQDFRSGKRFVRTINHNNDVVCVKQKSQIHCYLNRTSKVKQAGICRGGQLWDHRLSEQIISELRLATDSEALSNTNFSGFWLKF